MKLYNINNPQLCIKADFPPLSTILYLEEEEKEEL